MNVKSIEEIAYHRNGVCGNGFHVVRFTGGPDTDKEGASGRQSQPKPKEVASVSFHV